MDLLKLLPEGSSVLAVIVIVILFLRQQREQEKRLEAITNAFNARVLEVTVAFQNQIDRLTKQVFEDKLNTQTQMQRLFDGFMTISKETVQALVELRGAVTTLTSRVDLGDRQIEEAIERKIDDRLGHTKAIEQKD